MGELGLAFIEQTKEYKKAAMYIQEVWAEGHEAIRHNIKIWDEDVHGALCGDNVARLIRKQHHELHSLNAPFWRALSEVATYEVRSLDRSVESLVGALVGFDHYLCT